MQVIIRDVAKSLVCFGPVCSMKDTETESDSPPPPSPVPPPPPPPPCLPVFGGGPLGCCVHYGFPRPLTPGESHIDQTPSEMNGWLADWLVVWPGAGIDPPLSPSPSPDHTG